MGEKFPVQTCYVTHKNNSQQYLKTANVELKPIMKQK